jgi:magnesium chelatase subunit I
MPRPHTLGALKESGYRSRTVKDEMRTNLLRKLEAGETLFPGVLGYEETVEPQIVNAILARQNFILLGLRGQAKSRIVRRLADLLDDALPIIAGSEVNDDPLRPVSKYGRQTVEEHGDDTPIEWVGRDARYIEKLATPDVTIADIIGDLDPIRAARGGHVLADELTIHFGLLPRANRGIFAVNELPDLAGRIQVGLFNIMQEGDVQIKGYPVRLPLDVLLVFTANPEDYTARGKIITPLKDRIGAEVMTHYPEEVEAGIDITLQEAWLERDGTPVRVPGFVVELIERVAFLARTDKRIDQRSGVSQRMPITVLENAVSNAERRAVLLGEEVVVPRVSDVHAALPAITGKMELEYEGELQGAPAWYSLPTWPETRPSSPGWRASRRWRRWSTASRSTRGPRRSAPPPESWCSRRWWRSGGSAGPKGVATRADPGGRPRHRGRSSRGLSRSSAPRTPPAP